MFSAYVDRGPVSSKSRPTDTLRVSRRASSYEARAHNQPLLRFRSSSGRPRLFSPGTLKALTEQEKNSKKALCGKRPCTRTHESGRKSEKSDQKRKR